MSSPVLAVIGKELLRGRVLVPQVEGRDALFAEKAHQIGMRVVGQDRVERVLPGIAKRL
jgi:hypothetical protein